MAAAAVDVHLRAPDVLRQPATVRGWDQHVGGAVPDLDWDCDVADVEAPRTHECEIVVDPTTNT